MKRVFTKRISDEALKYSRNITLTNTLPTSVKTKRHFVDAKNPHKSIELTMDEIDAIIATF
jgi:hypothetical protein